ncbi:MAG: serine hydrolase domain-containing protein [Propionibacteriaceae bacterium]
MSELSARLDQAASETDFHGVVRLDRAGVTEVDRAYGLADRRHHVPMTVDSQLGIASGSKAMTALVVMALVERGVWSLSTRARDLLGSDLPLIGDDVTLEHLLAHRSGIGDYLDEESAEVEDYAMPISVHLLATTVQFLPVLDGHPTKFSAGERFSYCNGGYVVLALLAERVTGATYQDLVHDLVCQPAGMVDSGFFRSDDLPERAAVGYVDLDGRRLTNVFHLPVVGNGDGGLYSTTADVHRFWAALFDHRIVTGPTLQQMLPRRSSSGPSPSDHGYGLGFWRPAAGDQVMLEGCDAGVSFRSVHDLVAGATYTVISNTTDGAWPLARVMDAALVDPAGISPRP